MIGEENVRPLEVQDTRKNEKHVDRVCFTLRRRLVVLWNTN